MSNNSTNEAIAIILAGFMVLCLAAFFLYDVGITVLEKEQTTKTLLERQYPTGALCRIYKTKHEIMIVDHSTDRVKVMFIESGQTQWISPYDFLVGCKP